MLQRWNSSIAKSLSPLVRAGAAIFAIVGAAHSDPRLSTVFCEPAVGGVIACVCANAPVVAGEGCTNTGGSGATLSSAGIESVTLDSVVLTGGSMFAGGNCIFLQGNADVAAGVTFGAGVRCAGGIVKRLYLKPIAGGTASAPAAGDAKITVQGAPIAAGDVRYYQVFYRDPLLPNPGGACPADATFNITAGLKITWAL